jgi:predicted nucleic acid-binding protein
LRVVGTVAVLFEAHKRSLLDFERVIDDLRNTTFYVDESLIQTIVARMKSK